MNYIRKLRAFKVSHHIRKSKTVLDSGFWILRLGFRIPGPEFQSLTVELGFSIPIVSRILDSFSCIQNSKTPHFGFHKKKFP